MAESYGGQPFQEVAPDRPAIVARLREMALCLDVTEAPPASPEDVLLAADARLEGCESYL